MTVTKIVDELERIRDGGRFNPECTGGVIAEAIDIINDWDEGKLNCLVAQHYSLN